MKLLSIDSCIKWMTTFLHHFSILGIPHRVVAAGQCGRPHPCTCCSQQYRLALSGTDSDVSCLACVPLSHHEWYWACAHPFHPWTLLLRAHQNDNLLSHLFSISHSLLAPEIPSCCFGLSHKLKFNGDEGTWTVVSLYTSYWYTNDTLSAAMVAQGRQQLSQTGKALVLKGPHFPCPCKSWMKMCTHCLHMT